MSKVYLDTAERNREPRYELGALGPPPGQWRGTPPDGHPTEALGRRALGAFSVCCDGREGHTARLGVLSDELEKVFADARSLSAADLVAPQWTLARASAGELLEGVTLGGCHAEVDELGSVASALLGHAANVKPRLELGKATSSCKASSRSRR